MKNQIFSLLFVLFAFGCGSTQAPNQKHSSMPLNQKGEPIQVTDGFIWLSSAKLPKDSIAFQKIKDLSNGEWDFSKYLNEILGNERNFSFVNEQGKLIDVKVISAEYYNFDLAKSESYKKFMQKMGDCNGYPASSIRVHLTKDDGKAIGNGLLFPKGSTVHTKPSKNFVEQYSIYRKTHSDFIEKNYPKMFPPYGPTIDQYSYGISTPDGSLYFVGPSPAIEEDKHPIYLFRQNSKEIVPIALPAPVMCAS
jgi:hypothetical protein